MWVGIDPDTIAPGVVILGNTGLVRHARVTSYDSVEAMALYAPRDIAQMIRVQMVTCDEEITVVVEGQYIGARGSRIPPMDIVNLAKCAGILASVVSHLGEHACLLMPTPMRWKGSVGKAIHQPRILTAVPSLEGWREEFSADEWKDVVDAAGLANWARLGGRVPPSKLTMPKEKPPNPFSRTGSRSGSRPASRRRKAS